jgi:hypothetical protein
MGQMIRLQIRLAVAALLVTVWQASGATPCQQFPAGLIPFAKIYYALGSSASYLVAGDPGNGGFDKIRNLPLPAAPDQMFCDARIELAPGAFFSSVYVPSAAERNGDFSQTKDANGRILTLYDPMASIGGAGRDRTDE